LDLLSSYGESNGISNYNNYSSLSGSSYFINSRILFPSLHKSSSSSLPLLSLFNGSSPESSATSS
jgi:hypothetical protein